MNTLKEYPGFSLDLFNDYPICRNKKCKQHMRPILQYDGHEYREVYECPNCNMPQKKNDD